MQHPITSAVQTRITESLMPHSNLRAWRRCYDLFGRSDVETNDSALHLAFFLASWGMMRGSSFLRRFDYTVHIPVVELLSEPGVRALRGAIPDDIDTIKAIVDTKKRIEAAYRLSANDPTVHVTDTLSSKIMLAALGCVPAYDRFFVAGARLHSISGSFETRSLRQLADHVAKLRSEYDRAQTLAESKLGGPVPIMRLVDMYFFTEGERHRNDGQT